MSISDQLSGLPMDHLIGGPLNAAAKAQADASKITAEFIEHASLDKIETSKLVYTDGGGVKEVDVPLLSIVPIPSLQVDEVTVNFDMEVKQSTDKQPPED